MKRKLLVLMLAAALSLGLACPALAVVEEIAAVKVDDVTGYSQSDGVYTVVQDGLYGFYWADGSELAAPEFASAADFQDGMAAVSSAYTGLYGYLNLDGSLSIPQRYRQAFPFAEDRAFAVRDRDGALVLLDRDGQELASFPDAVLQAGESIQFSEGLAVIPVLTEAEDAEPEENGEPEEVPEEPAKEPAEAEAAFLAYRVVDRNGETLCTLTDAYVDYRNGYHDGRIAAAESGSWTEAGQGAYQRFQAEAGAWGYRDTAGELAVAYRYDEAAPFSEGMAGVGLKGEDGRTLYGFIDPGGNEIFPLEYDGFVSCVNGSGALLREDGRWAYVDAAGRMLTRFLFDELSNFSEDVARVRTNGALELVDWTGTALFTLEDGQALPCSGGVVPVQNGDGLWGIYDKSGRLLVDFEYERVFHWDGCLWLKRGGLWRVYLTEEVIADRAAAAVEENPAVESVAAVGAFSDVPPDAYYAQAVTWATDSDIVAGTGGGLFSPDRPCTTGEILTCLWRAAGRPEPQVENPFEDVAFGHYYYEAALWAYENGLVEGGTLGAAAPCTRAMVVTYLWGMEGRPPALTDVFADVPADAPWAQAVAWAVARRITEGDGSGLFNPDGICSRGQIVTFLYRYMAG